LNEKYFKELKGQTGNTVMKIQEDTFAGNQLIVRTDNKNVESILQKNETQILADINMETGVVLNRINII
jgi:hypothetical protein